MQDVLFLVGIFVFISILIIGLFPGKNVMIVQEPGIFHLRRHDGSPGRCRSTSSSCLFGGTCIPACRAPARVSRARWPWPSCSWRFSRRCRWFSCRTIILNQTLSSLILDKTSNALNEAITMSNDPVVQMMEEHARRAPGRSSTRWTTARFPSPRRAGDSMSGTFTP